MVCQCAGKPLRVKAVVGAGLTAQSFVIARLGHAGQGHHFAVRSCSRLFAEGQIIQ
jgi:hypothetical protein